MTTVTRQSMIDEWAAANPRSRALHDRARGVLPDGVAHDVRRARPFPVAVERAKGSRKWDADGHELICYVMGHGSLLLGHGHPEVVEAIRARADVALHPGACHELETEWAEEVVRLVPSAERVRFTSSGTEATLLALHVARAYSGRERVVKLLGHFHGWHDHLAFGSEPPFEQRPPGIPSALAGLVDVVPADAPAVERALAGGDVAAVILEPAGGLSGTLPLPDGLLAGVRKATQRHGSLLIFDEVVTGFRWGPGGVQGLSGVVPDLTTLGKVLAGGMPGGAVAGRRSVMEVLDSAASPEGKVHHSGTHNAHPLAAAAGITTLRIVADGAAQRAADARADQLRRGFDTLLAERGVAGFAYGPSSHVCLMLGIEPPDPRRPLAEQIDATTLRQGITGRLADALHCGMLLHGVQLFHGHCFLSVAHTDADMEHTFRAFAATLEGLRRERLV